jgi:hypothetical protein
MSFATGTRDTDTHHAGHTSISRAVMLCLVATISLWLSACASKKNYVPLGEVESRFSFDEEFLKERGVDGDDSAEIQNKIANKGWEKDEDGKFVARNPDLYSDKEVGKGRDVKKKDMYLSKREAETKYYKKPEYLKRQEFATTSAREGGDSAREGLFDRNRANEAGRSASANAKPGFLAGLNPFKTGSARESGSSFSTSSDRIGTQGQRDSARATGVSQAELGYYTDSINTMDDVKKLLHPEAFGRD